MVEGVRRIDGRAIVEASGGITLDTIGAVAATGVDVISVGALTHSVRALDLGLDVVVGRRAMTYLDAAATTPVRREVLEAMWPYLTTTYGNPSSHHEVGEAAARGLEAARRAVAEILGARPAEITFTSGGTEGANTAIKGIALARPARSARDRLRGRAPGRARVGALAGHASATTSPSSASTPTVGSRPTDLAAALRPDTTLVSIQYANNEVGTIQPIAELTAITAAYDVPFHTDAVQAAGWLDLDVGRLGVQALSLSGHKVGAPKGVGVLYVARRTPIEPLIHGGGQQRGLRSGTEDVAGAVGMATALRLARTADAAAVTRATRRLHRPGRGGAARRPPDRPPYGAAARARLVRAPRRQRRVGAARPGAARRDLLQRLRLRRRQRRALPRPDRDGHPGRDRADRAALHLRGRRHRRTTSTGGRRARGGRDRSAPGPLVPHRPW